MILPFHPHSPTVRSSLSGNSRTEFLRGIRRMLPVALLDFAALNAALVATWGLDFSRTETEPLALARSAVWIIPLQMLVLWLVLFIRAGRSPLCLTDDPTGTCLGVFLSSELLLLLWWTAGGSLWPHRDALVLNLGLALLFLLIARRAIRTTETSRQPGR